jgi:hypothetical protein
MSEDRAFRRFMDAVDDYIADVLGGLVSDDIPDYDYWSAYSAGICAEETARRAIRNAKDS